MESEPNLNEVLDVYKRQELEAFAKSSRENVWPQLAKNYPDGWLDKVAASLE